VVVAIMMMRSVVVFLPSFFTGEICSMRRKTSLGMSLLFLPIYPLAPPPLLRAKEKLWLMALISREVMEGSLVGGGGGKRRRRRRRRRRRSQLDDYLLGDRYHYHCPIPTTTTNHDKGRYRQPTTTTTTITHPPTHLSILLMSFVLAVEVLLSLE